MSEKLPTSEYHGVLPLGTIEVDCHVLNTGQRVITQRGLWRLLLSGTDHGHFNRYLARIPYDDKPLEVVPMTFRAPGGLAHGYAATVFLEYSHLPALQEPFKAPASCGPDLHDPAVIAPRVRDHARKEAQSDPRRVVRHPGGVDWGMITCPKITAANG